MTDKQLPMTPSSNDELTGASASQGAEGAGGVSTLRSVTCFTLGSLLREGGLSAFHRRQGVTHPQG